MINVNQKRTEYHRAYNKLKYQTLNKSKKDYKEEIAKLRDTEFIFPIPVDPQPEEPQVETHRSITTQTTVTATTPTSAALKENQSLRVRLDAKKCQCGFNLKILLKSVNHAPSNLKLYIYLTALNWVNTQFTKLHHDKGLMHAVPLMHI